MATVWGSTMGAITAPNKRTTCSEYEARTTDQARATPPQPEASARSTPLATLARSTSTAMAERANLASIRADGRARANISGDAPLVDER